MTEIKNTRHNVRLIDCFRNVFSFYTNYFSTFWRVMIPSIILSILLDIVILYFFYNHMPNTTWEIDTSIGAKITSESQIGFFNWRITFASTIMLFLWFTIYPLILSTSELCRGRDVYVKDIWQRTLHKAKSIIGASLFLLIVLIFVGFFWIYLTLLIADTGSQFLSVSFIMITICIGVFWIVKWSLFNQGIIIENQTVINSFRRSSNLVHGRWGGFFIRYFLVIWGTGIVFSLLFGLTYSLLATVEPQFTPIRDEFFSGGILTLLSGIEFSFSFSHLNFAFGNISAVLEKTPKYLVVLVLFVLKTVLYGFFAHIWVILMTHLYFEQIGDVTENAMIQ